jgi:hypothetical protein
MITAIVTKSLGVGIAASILLSIWTDLSAGAISGLVAGLVVGAIIVPLIQVPDALGRALLLAVFFGLGMAGYQLVRILAVTGSSMGSILDNLNTPVVGQAIINGLLYVLYALLAGALIGVLITVPDRALKGGLIGMLFGVILGVALYWLLGRLGIYLNLTVFRLLVGVLIFGVLTAITGN